MHDLNTIIKMNSSNISPLNLILKPVVVLPNQRTKIEWTQYLATAYAEGFCEGENATVEEIIEAWAFLIMTGLCWSLQGFFGRTAQAMLDAETVLKNGRINWELIDERLS